MRALFIKNQRKRNLESRQSEEKDSIYSENDTKKTGSLLERIETR